MRATVVGAGSWGTALAGVLAEQDAVTMWDVDPEPLESIATRHENTRYLPGIRLADNIRAQADLESALVDTELIILAVPSQAMRGVAELVRPHLRTEVVVCSVTKGIEIATSMMMSEVLEDVLPVPQHPYLAYLSGPSFAIEVAHGHPTAVTVAAHWHRVAEQVQAAFHTKMFRPYTSNDVVGIEIGGCAKNVIAIATGLADGLGYAANARAALVTRGLAEITRLGIAKGANPLTLSGLAGVGDLMLTCTSEKSRNYRVGFGLGQGRSLAEVQEELGQVAEGVFNAKSVRGLAAELGVEMPITEAVYRLLYGDLSPEELFTEVLGRDLKREF